MQCGWQRLHREARYTEHSKLRVRILVEIGGHAAHCVELHVELLDLRVDVTVADENVGPAIVVHVEEADAPAEILGVDA